MGGGSVAFVRAGYGAGHHRPVQLAYDGFQTRRYKEEAVGA